MTTILPFKPYLQKTKEQHSHSPAHTDPMSPLHQHLTVRGANSNGTTNSNLSDGAIIIIVLAAAGFAVLVGYSVTRFYFDKDQPDRARPLGDAQLQYMLSVRRRNLDSLGFGLGAKNYDRGSLSQFSDPDVRSDGRRSAV